jgi:hypothetical protein
MPKSRLLIITLSTAMLFALADAASAAKAKRPTYDEAWALCKAKMDTRIPWFEHAQRTSAGTSCMKRYGYRI